MISPTNNSPSREPDVIDISSDEYFMREALRQAQIAFEAEEVPVGALVVLRGKIIGRACNQVETLKDATAHAEILAITQAAAALGDWRLTDATLFVTKEPCPMCAGAIVLSRVKRCVFGAADPKSGAAGSVHDLLNKSGLNHKVAVRGGVLEEQARGLLQSFFAAQRQQADV